MAFFSKFAFYPITPDENLNEKFRIKALMKYAHCLDGIRPIIRLKTVRVGCTDIESGFFEFSEIRFGNPSDFSAECFRKWDYKVMKIGKLQLYPDNHCGVDAVRFALVRCQGKCLIVSGPAFRPYFPINIFLVKLDDSIPSLSPRYIFSNLFGQSR